MPEDERISVLLDARDTLSQELDDVEDSLDEVRDALAKLGGSMEASRSSAERAEEGMEDVGDDAQKASIKVAELASTFDLAKANLRDVTAEIDVELDDVEGATAEALAVREAVIETLESEDADIPVDIDRDDLLAKLQNTKEFADAFYREREVQLHPDLNEKTIVPQLQDAKQIAESVTDDIELDLDANLDAAAEAGRKASEAAEGAAGDIDIDADISEASAAELAAELNSLIELAEATAGEINIDIDIDAGEEAVELALLVSEMSEVEIEALKVAATSRSAASGIDEMGDEATESAGEMGILASTMNLASLNTTALSLNVGAFNIALSNLATQIPILVGLIGTLGTALAGVAGAAVLAATGIAGIVGAGVFAELTRVEEQFSNIENKMEAMQAITQSLVDQFEKAFEPLLDAAEGTNIFFETVNNLLETINVFAKGIADSMRFSAEEMREFREVGESLGIVGDTMSDAEFADQIMSIGEFMDELGRIWQDNVGDIISATKVMSAFLLPVLADIIEFFIAGFDDMILFATKFTRELAKLGPVFNSIIQFAVEIINLTSTVLQGLLPVIVGAMAVATELASALNSLDSNIIRNIAGIALLTKMLAGLRGAYVGLSGAVSTIIRGTQLEAFWKHLLAVRTMFLNKQITKEQALRLSLASANVTVANTLRSITQARFLENSLMARTIKSLGKLTMQYVKQIPILGTLISTIGSYIVAMGGYIVSMFSAAVANQAFMAPLLPIVVALGAIAAIGAIVVGVLSNMGDVTSGLGNVMAGLKAILGAIADVLLGVFISTWNSMAMILEGVMAMVNPLIDAFSMVTQALGLAGEGGSSTGSAFAFLKTVLEALFLPIESLFAVIGGLAKIIGTILGVAIHGLVQIVGALAAGVSNAINVLLEIAGVSGTVSDGLSGITDTVVALIDAILSLPQTIRNVADSVSKWIKQVANFVIGVINSLIEEANKIPGLDIGTLDKMDIDQGNARISREDVVEEDTDDADESVTAKQANEFNYNEENVNNVAQEINADPEDEAGLERVVKDAMREADAFVRRNEGHSR